MRQFALILTAALLLALTGCATTATRVSTELDKLPEHADGEVAVFGKIRLIEFVARAPMPSPEQDASVYIIKTDTGNTYKLRCLDTGEFGAYLPAGEYHVARVAVSGYTLAPEELTLFVPDGHDASYAGSVVLDGTPSGVTNGDMTRFVLTVKDEYRDFASGLRRSNVSEARVVKSLFRPGSAFANGDYPTKVMRAKDVENDLRARAGAVEEVVKGVFIAIPYVLNPVWILTLP
ncbi:MAG: hypothetical protein HZC51_02125 [Nitrospirae bacterium]|nr:hypothetical protein [Nitrospirota bacterium]